MIRVIGEKTNVEVSNTHEVFSGTPYAEEEFRFFVKPMPSSRLTEIKKKNTRVHPFRELTDNDAVQRDKFVEQVTGWEGVVDNDLNPIECNEKNKKAFVEMADDIAIKVLAAADQLFDQERVAPKSETT